MSKVRMSESNVLVKTLNDCPVVICLYITILITYGLVYFLNSDLEYLNFNVIDFYKKKQWWRLVSSTICHSSIAHLFICLTTLFEIRKIEVLVGSSFFLRNSVVVLVANRLIFSAIILIADYFTSRTLDNYFSRSFQSFGMDGLLYAWFAFFSVIHPEEHVYILGFIPISSSMAPLILLLIMQLILPKSPNFLDYSAGVLIGILLALRLFNVLPNTYWTLCLVFDILCITLYSILVHIFGPPTVTYANSNHEERNDSSPEPDIENQLARSQVDIDTVTIMDQPFQMETTDVY